MIDYRGTGAEEQRRLHAIRQRMMEMQHQQRGGGAPPPLPTQQNRSQKMKRKQQQVARPAPPPMRQPAPPPAPEPETIITSPTATPVNETARNVRMLLQRSGIREAFLLAEILGKPKSLE